MTTKINIQHEVMKIHHQYGTSEKANYEIQKLCDSYADQKVKDRNQDIKDWMENNTSGWYSDLIQYLNSPQIPNLDNLKNISTKNYGDDGIVLSEEGFNQLLNDESTPINDATEKVSLRDGDYDGIQGGYTLHILDENNHPLITVTTVNGIRCVNCPVKVTIKDGNVQIH
jgi:hypothetical protein